MTDRIFAVIGARGPRLLIVRAAGQRQVEERLAADCWSVRDLLRIRQISPWSLRLRSRSDP